MYSNAEIKDRFERGLIIDRHGFELDPSHYDRGTVRQFTRMCHYAILDGMPESAVREEFKRMGFSPIEIDEVMKETLEFIEEILGIDLRAREMSRNSTQSIAYRLLASHVVEINNWYDSNRFAPIAFESRLFDADQKARESLNSVKLSGKAPTYWTDATNHDVEDWTMAKVEALSKAIAERELALHERVATMKHELRVACEKAQLIVLQQFKLPSE